MELKLTQQSANMLFLMFVNPTPLCEAGGVRAYQAKDDPGQLEAAAVCRWIKQKVATELAPGSGQFRVHPYEGRVKDHLIKRMLDAAKHYEPAGRVVYHCEAYSELVAALNGKTMEIEDAEEPEPTAKV